MLIFIMQSFFRKTFVISVFFVVLFSSFTDSDAASYVSIKIEPENVGVFYVNKTQQFTAFGETAAGDFVDITDQVDWYVEPFPFAEQTLSAREIVTIDETGLATVLSTWGRVKISACLPKGCGGQNQPGWIPAINLLLHKTDDGPQYFPWINFLLLNNDGHRKR